MTQTNNTAILDIAVVLFSMFIISCIVAGLLFVHDIPQASLPILSSLATGILGLPAMYAAFRWGSSVTAKKLAGTQEAGE